MLLVPLVLLAAVVPVLVLVRGLNSSAPRAAEARASHHQRSSGRRARGVRVAAATARAITPLTRSAHRYEYAGQYRILASLSLYDAVVACPAARVLRTSSASCPASSPSVAPR